MVSFIYLELKEEEISYWMIAIFGVSLFFGLLSLLLMFCVTCSDPGIVSVYEDTHTDGAYIRNMSFREEEFKIKDTDPVY